MKWVRSAPNHARRGPLTWLAAFAGALAAGALMPTGCSSEDRAPPPASTQRPIDDAGFIDTGNDDPPPLDASGLCGNELIPIVDDRPNLYFVVDHSGSMNQEVAGRTLAEATHDAIRDVLQLVGPHVRYGAAVFPNPAIGECAAGAEVYRLRAGEPAPEGGGSSATLRGLLNALDDAPVRGGTPVSTTFEVLESSLLDQDRRTYVILATDGGPNCNPKQACTAADCQLNIEGATVGGFECDAHLNCCDPGFALGAQLNCLDRDPSVARVAALRASGVDTFVIGMVGSEPYQATLNQLAVAGGRSRAANPRYYPADSPQALSDALIEIGLAVAISCTVELDQKPPEPNKVNVYFDTELIPNDDSDGWRWVDDTHIELVGSRCVELQSAKVDQVQIVSGCPTELK
ncbi:MAG: vWA domain-containing protein [Polyangiaceae bacterium]